ncbi:MAG TPA: glutamate-1-semialdehyde 2,1-aminomutase, partial [Candidatus Acidoferrales bacterium]|nr:glutamate-1-semialdehyde 2,1-aminomutase [Candidatus Acidoferrales bacterium]
RASKLIPGGGSSNAQCSPTYDPYPLTLSKGAGSRVWDVDGNVYVDYLLGFGPLILGHCHPSVLRAVKAQLENGLQFAMLDELQVKLAEKIHEMVPNAEMVRFSMTGAEATMSAIRIARGYTGRDKIIKFEGHYHGAHDYVLLNIVGAPRAALGSEVAPYKVPASPGIPVDTIKNTVVIPWNNLDILEKTVKRYSNELAAVIMEPVMMDIGISPPEEGYLKTVREITRKHDVMLIFDEVITGFRLASGGAQQYFGVTPDLACFAKALGGGFPIAAITGRREILEQVGPGKVMHAGTFNGNPISCAAAYATLTELTANDGENYRHMNKVGTKLQEGLERLVSSTRTEAIVQGMAQLGVQILFTPLKKIRNYREFLTCDEASYNRYHREMLKRGVLFHPLQYQHLFVSTAHSEDDIDLTLTAAEESLKAIA